MHKITGNHQDQIGRAVYDGEDFQENVPIVVHCESEEEALEIAARVTTEFGGKNE